MTCSDRYDLRIQDSSGEAHNLLCDWGRGGAGLKIDKATDAVRSTAVSTKGDFGVRDVSDSFRIIQTDWSEGSGQSTYDRDADSAAAFDSSRNIDVSVPGTLRLGPKTSLSAQETAPLPTAMLPAIIAHGTSSDTPTVWAGFSDGSTATNRIAWSTDGETWTALTAGGPTNTPISFASDGETLWAVITGGTVYTVTPTGSATFSSDGSNTNMTNVAFTAGYLYAAQGTASSDAVLGTFSGATPPVWSQLTPTEGEAINAAGVTFGLVASGSYVYWGVTNGMVSKVLKCRYVDGSGDSLTTVATFPTGFVGASMCAYLGTVYVGGHFDWTEPNTGLGSIYAIVEDTPIRLTDIGSSKDVDNRVLAMAAYEKNLFFVSNNQIWRWDLVSGGYSHYAGPLSSTPVTAYGDLAWEQTYTMDTAPTEAEFTSTGTAGVAYGEKFGVADDAEVHSRTWATGSSASVEIDLTQTVTMTEDNTLEFDIPAGAVDSQAGAEDVCYVGIRNGTRSAKVNIWRRTWVDQWPFYTDQDSGGYDCTLASGSTTLQSFLIAGADVGHTIRLTLEGNEAKAYVDGVLMASGTTTSSTSQENVYWGITNSSTYADTKFYIDEIRWATGIYDPNESLDATASGVALACFRDRVVAACSGYGSVYTDPTLYAVTDDEGVSPYITFSRTSGNMPTVNKYFSAIHMTLESPLPMDDDGVPLVSITALPNIDGKTVTISPDDVSGTQLVFSFPSQNAQGRLLSLQFIIANADENVTPVITEVSVLFEPMPKVPKSYTYFLRCWEKAQDNSNNDWEENARVVADWLEEIAGEVVLVERPGRDSYTGRIESLEYLEASPSTPANGREGLYQMTVKKV